MVKCTVFWRSELQKPAVASIGGNTSKVTVVGYANRNKPEEMRAERIIVDGKTVELR